MLGTVLQHFNIAPNALEKRLLGKVLKKLTPSEKKPQKIEPKTQVTKLQSMLLY